MKKKYLNFNDLFEGGGLSLPDIPVQLETKKRILHNILSSTQKKNNRINNYLQLLKPALFAACILLILGFPIVNYNLIPQSINDGYYLTVEANVEGAEVYFGKEKIDVVPTTQKIQTDNVEIRVVKEGFLEWKGRIKGEVLEEALNSFFSTGKYRLFKGHNSIKLIVQLEEILKNTIYLQSQERAKVILNGKFLGETPLYIELQPKINKIEVIQPLKEKVTFDIVYEGKPQDKLTVLGRQELQLTESGYTIYIQSEELYFPIKGMWLEEKEYLLLESNGKEQRIKSIDLRTRDISVKELTEIEERIIEILKDDKDYLEVIIDLKDYPLLEDLLVDLNILYLDERENHFIIFALDDYVNIWLYSLEEEILQKIY
ncbi:PEGA domain-containing protein [Anaerobranca gottschalkii]|uniref:PEGA domain-containing protein n=1 Tax=Anaerobranca gottschalkii DSM 13577 TaxID=1120990 RepID=A0A1I0AZ94_9FIRM|nr:PEGA domain-containing protein [Anaerobranca gottschalkii]SES99753.1 PEGA domain-containing protein [Anaerobranca gottschalkii DSM 13577]